MHKRGLTTFLTLVGFILMTITGIVLYFTPQGRIAYWVNWTFLGLTKTDWTNIHIVSSLLWVVALAFHLYFNWKVLMAYIYKKAQGGWKLKKEMAISVLAGLIVWFFPIYQIPPISYITDLGAALSDSWVTSPEYEPPVGHAEQLSFTSFLKKVNIPLEPAIAELKKQGIEVGDTNQAVETIAKQNNTSPMNMYMAIRSLEQKPELVPASSGYTLEMVEEQFNGTGVGRKVLGDVLGDLKMDLNEAKAKLAAKGVEVKDDETFKDVADRYGVTPIDILKALLVNDYQLNK